MTEEAQVAAPQAEAPPAPAWAPEVEQEAKALGWKAPDEWKGDIPPGYIDNPAKYLERAEKFTPFVKLKESLTKQFDEKLSKLETVASKALERQRADAERTIAQLQQQKLAAVETGDVEQYKALEKQQREVAQSMAEPAPPPSGIRPEEKTAIDRWAAGKDWFKTDVVMTQAAVAYYDEGQRKGLTDPVAILEYVDGQIAKKFRIGESAPVTAAPVSAVTPGLTFGASPSADAFSKLPKDAQETFKRFVAKGLFTDDKAGRAAYAEDYNAA